MRTFVAIVVDGAPRQAFPGACDRVRAALGADARHWAFSRGDSLHLTLAFLGEIPVDRLPHVHVAAREACTGQAPFSLELAEVGAFPTSRRPRVLWIGAREGAPVLAALAVRIAQALSLRGFPVDQRPFQPHLTLARLRRGAPSRSADVPISTLAGLDLGSQPIGAVTVFRSDVHAHGAVHTPIAVVSLVGV